MAEALEKKSSVGGISMALLGFGSFIKWALKYRKEREADCEQKLDIAYKRIDELIKRVEEMRLRISALENRRDTKFPAWRKTQEGTYLWVNAPYIEKILIPLGMSPKDIYGKREDEISQFNTNLRVTLLEIEKKAALYGCGCASHVIFHSSAPPMTVIKETEIDTNGGITFYAFSCPEY